MNKYILNNLLSNKTNYFPTKYKIPNNIKKLNSDVSQLNYHKFCDKLPSVLTNLEFDDKFNKPVTISNYVIHLKFGWYFNQPVIIPNSVKHIAFGEKFNQKSTYLIQ